MKPKKQENFMGIECVTLYEVAYTFLQDSDTNQSVDDGQELKAYTMDSGGGSYIIIETARWAIDHDDIDKFADALKRIVAIPEGT